MKVMYAVSLKAQANCFDPATLDSPLHLAVALRQPNIFGYLLLVRVWIYLCLQYFVYCVTIACKPFISFSLVTYH